MHSGIVSALCVVTGLLSHRNGLHGRVAEILSFLWVCSMCMCMQATCCCGGGCCEGKQPPPAGASGKNYVII